MLHLELIFSLLTYSGVLKLILNKKSYIAVNQQIIKPYITCIAN